LWASVPGPFITNSTVRCVIMTINLATFGVGRRGNEKWRRGEGLQGRGEGCEDGVRKRGG